MIRKFLLVVVLASLNIVANAQEEKIRFGAKFGLNVSNQLGDQVALIDYKSRTDFHVGALVEIPLSSKFAFAPELVYSSQGSKTEADIMFPGFSIGGESTVTLNYINLPLMAKYYVAEGFSFQVGPQIGFLLSAKEKGSINENGVISQIDVDTTDLYKDIDLGINFGLGYQLEMGIFLDARYNVGLTNINDLDLEIGELEVENQNGVFQLSAGYKF